MTGDVDELKSKVSPVTVGFAIILVIIGYYVGFVHSELKSQSKLLEVQHGFALDEIDGLRQDVYREDRHIWREIDDNKNNWRREIDDKMRK